MRWRILWSVWVPCLYWLRLGRAPACERVQVRIVFRAMFSPVKDGLSYGAIIAQAPGPDNHIDSILTVASSLCIMICIYHDRGILTSP